ncbi:MAG: hypothetical protein OEW48_11725 [Phycisphaerae bacterium]|nr:hypothetical protein [Phycisphaerae bacterium]
MNYENICELRDYVGQEVTLAVWLYNSRSSGKIQLLSHLREKFGM